MFWIRISFILFISMLLSITVELSEVSLFNSREIISFMVCFIIVLLIYTTRLLTELRAGQEQLIRLYQMEQGRSDNDKMEERNSSDTQREV